MHYNGNVVGKWIKPVCYECSYLKRQFCPIVRRGNSMRVHYLAHTQKIFVSIFVFKSLPLFVMWLIVQQLLPKHVMCVNLSADVHIGANLWCGQIFFWVTEDMSYILCSGFLWPRVSSFSPSIMYLEKIGGEKKALFLDSLKYLLTDQLCLQLKYQLWE